MFRERCVHGRIRSEHIVQLFDRPESLARAVADFLLEGLRAGEHLIVAITAEHWRLTAERLAADGADLDAATAAGTLVVLDATTTLKQLVRNEEPDASQFETLIGSLIRHRAAEGATVRVYGELVDLLAAEGNYRAAHSLETQWNALGEQVSFTLFCGYSAVHFGDATRDGPALRGICQTHTQVRTNASDRLATWLVDKHAIGKDPSGHT